MMRLKFRGEVGSENMEEMNAENFSENNERKKRKNIRNPEIEQEYQVIV